MTIGGGIEEIERRRGSTVLVIAATNLEIELLPPLYDTLREIGRSERLDVVFSCRGGVVHAARRIALLLHDFTDHLSFIVPHHCESSGTITVLAAHEIIAGPVAVFSPIDPLLQTSPTASDEGGPLGISAQDVRLFSQMSKDWFGLEEDEARQKALSVLCDNIFPTTLTSFYRSILEIQLIGAELLSLHMPPGSEAQASKIVDQLLFGHHSHGFALTRGDLVALGLPLRGDPAIEDLAWEIARELRGSVGGGARQAAEDDWFDALIATRTGSRRRRRSPGTPGSRWEAGEIE
ncbi:MAG: hypothetical protein Q8Q88_15900 [Phenylobacterium sp.]|uniref:SDH family Clp fold serine proteinase n=1 Tax=Phenylobacterium sp. TaxID=1871053 RepID=UPI002734E92F|nr:hypothetical protein [Phenylobacterium sp.]MDP3748523.1 hypothetical protein [Phenylobacterium sp.]